ncbi:hypothetical protein [Azospirillum halopraeferens]|uniref:hypothetical protein n=1 Tax=Azospirillum halopraeferens TaxID=34010 RepID=UPI00041C4C68|nr:hypothetical protein [Azospirillum halopraeferens]
MARYRIETSDDGRYRSVKAFTQAANVRLLGDFPETHSLVTDDLPADLRERVVAAGARVTRDPGQGGDAMKDSFVAWLKAQTPPGISWTRDDKYKASP